MKGDEDVLKGDEKALKVATKSFTSDGKASKGNREKSKSMGTR